VAPDGGAALFLRLLRSACCVGLQRSFVGSSYSCTILIYVSAIYISCNKLSRLRRIGAGNWLHGESDDWDVIAVLSNRRVWKRRWKVIVLFNEKPEA
jgi:hypothetical protein